MKINESLTKAIFKFTNHLEEISFIHLSKQTFLRVKRSVVDKSPRSSH